MSEIKARLERFYGKYNPEKLDEVENTLVKYKGKEEQLFSALVRKYGPEPAGDEVVPPAAPVVAGLSLMEQRLHAFYSKYNPEKLPEVEKTLVKYKGKEKQLFDALVKKYGPEPGDEEEEDEEEDEEDEQEASHGENPLDVSILYCPIDTLPPEYCEYGPVFDECKEWLQQHTPNLMIQKYGKTITEVRNIEQQIIDGVEGITLEEVGKKGKTKKVKNKKIIDGVKDDKRDKAVYLEKLHRSKRKFLTIIVGLEDFESVKIKDASKKLGRKFACSASVTKLDSGKNQIQLQGDCLSELPQLLVDMFKIPEDAIFFVEKGSISAAF